MRTFYGHGRTIYYGLPLRIRDSNRLVHTIWQWRKWHQLLPEIERLVEVGPHDEQAAV